MAGLSTQRLLQIDRSIRAREFPNADSLAIEWEVSRRTVFYYRQKLLDMGAPLQFSKERSGWFYSEESWALPTTFVTEGELLAFFLAVEIAKRQMSGAVHLGLTNAIAKIAGALQGRVEIDLQALQNHYSFASPTSAHVEEEHLTTLHKAIRRQRVVAFDYLAFTTGKREQRRVHPHLLHHSQGDWYLLAFDEARRALRTFNLGRIDHLRVLANGFSRVDEQKIANWKAQEFGSEAGGKPHQVSIRFDAYQARYIRERQWHETQRIEESEGGGCVLHFASSGLGSIARWVLQYGSHAEVLAPDALREAVKNEVAALERIYSKGEK